MRQAYQRAVSALYRRVGQGVVPSDDIAAHKGGDGCGGGVSEGFQHGVLRYRAARRYVFGDAPLERRQVCGGVGVGVYIVIAGGVAISIVIATGIAITINISIAIGGGKREVNARSYAAARRQHRGGGFEQRTHIVFAYPAGEFKAHIVQQRLVEHDAVNVFRLGVGNLRVVAEGEYDALQCARAERDAHELAGRYG